MFLSEWRNFLQRLALQGKKNLTARVSMLLKSRASLTSLRDFILPGRAKDLSAPWSMCADGALAMNAHFFHKTEP